MGEFSRSVGGGVDSEWSGNFRATHNGLDCKAKASSSARFRFRRPEPDAFPCVEASECRGGRLVSRLQVYAARARASAEREGTSSAVFEEHRIARFKIEGEGPLSRSALRER